MSCGRSVPSRRAVLVAAALLPLAGCGPGDRSAQFAALERKHGARLGVYALATDTGAPSHRSPRITSRPE